MRNLLLTVYIKLVVREDHKRIVGFQGVEDGAKQIVIAMGEVSLLDKISTMIAALGYADATCLQSADTWCKAIALLKPRPRSQLVGSWEWVAGRAIVQISTKGTLVLKVFDAILLLEFRIQSL